ncbi:MAG: malto-oligosyltrehalose trehalohydrolase [Dehalococcoidia bacterium]
MNGRRWQPALGAWPEGDGVHFRTWAPAARQVVVRLEAGSAHALAPEPHGFFTGHVARLAPGARYRYMLDDGQALPDMASRFQPEGVHGPSEVVDPDAFAWTDGGWRGLDRDALTIYELHIGTFTPGGTFAAAAERLPALAELGVSAVQLLPIADFPGDRNWGYDGVSLFAPARCYGRPDDLRAFVDHAHALELGVILDVVYNHFGPDGAYHGAYGREWFNERHQTPWGAAINLDGPGNGPVRAFFIESARHWRHEYHVDGFRLDATHALVDESPRHFLAEYAAALHGDDTGRGRALLIAEDHRNLDTIVRTPDDRGGWDFDGVFADDFHHAVRRLLAGDHEGYFQDYAGTTGEIATALARGWIYTGEHSAFWNEPRGTDPAGIPLPRFVHCIQNHDQVGNRAFGNRLHADAPLAAVHAATALLLTSAATAFLFMGEEWAADTPFGFFTDHHEELGRLVTEGRRNEFRHWSAFRDPATRERIPDPQAEETFQRSRLDWTERDREPHASTLRLHRALLSLRRAEPTPGWTPGARQEAVALDADTVALRRNATAPGSGAALVIARLRGAGGHPHAPLLAPPAGSRWEQVLTTEDAAFAPEPMPVTVAPGDAGAAAARFARPGAVVLRTVDDRGGA